MPGLPFESLPAAQQDTMRPLQEQLQQTERYLQSRWDADFNALKYRGYDKQQFNNAYRQLYAKHLNLLSNARYKYDQQALKMRQTQQQEQQERQRVQELIKQKPEQPYTREQEAALRMELEPEAERLVFPKEKYLSPVYLRSRGFAENISGYAMAATDTPGWEWGPPKKQKQDLVNQYTNWRESELYHTKSINERQQLDREWDRMMLSSSIYNKWWKDKAKRTPVVDVRALRTTGQIAAAMREKVTPIGRSLSKGKRPLVEKIYGTGAEMRERYGFKPTGVPPREQRMSQPRTQAEYDKLPSGTQYVGTDGSVRTKR